MYFERPLEGVVQNKLMHVKTDCMVAQPKLSGDPDKPYFFLQERFAARFKQKQLWGKTDGSCRPPAGSNAGGYAFSSQRRTVKSSTPMFIIFMAVTLLKKTATANRWHFTTLKDLDYCVSRQYDSTQKADLLQIVYILRKLKELILGRTETVVSAQK